MASPDLAASRSASRSTVRWLALGLFLAYLFTSSGGFESADASKRYETARSWLDGHGGALPERLGWDGGAFAPNGRLYSYYGPLQSALMVPFLLAARAIPHAGVDPSVVETFAVALGLFPLLSTAAMVLVFLSLRLLGYPRRPALAATLGIALASLFWHYARMGQEENLLALAFAVWLYGAARLVAGRPWPAVLMAGGGVAALATRWASVPTLAVLLVVSLVLLARFRRAVRAPDLALGALVAASGVFLLLLYNRLRFDAWLETGYGLWNAHVHRQMFGLTGYGGHLAALLVSPYRGLFVYSPIVLAAAGGWFLARRGSPARLLAAGAFAALAVMTLFLASFYYWSGGHSWGPRFFASLQVLLAPPLASLFARWPRSAALVPAFAALQIFSTMLPESTEEYVWYNLDHDRPGWCSEWRAECTPVAQRIPRALEAVANTVAGRPGVTVSGRPLVAPEVVLSTSDYRTLYWWPLRIVFRLRALPLPAALLLCVAGLAAAAASLSAAWRSARDSAGPGRADRDGPRRGREALIAIDD
jgi:hypothetical protein